MDRFENSTVVKLLYGRVGRIEDVKMTEEHMRLWRKFEEKRSEFEKALKDMPEIRSLYSELNEYHEGMESESNISFYRYGFILGIKLGMEIAP